MTRVEIKSKLTALKRYQTDLVDALKARFRENISDAELSKIINGKQGNGIKTKRVLKEINIILSEWEDTHCPTDELKNISKEENT